MVGLQPLRRGGARGKLRGDPAVRTAAVALLTGHADPLGLLALERHDYATAVAVIEEAAELKSEYDQQLAEYTAARIAQQLIPGLSKTVLHAIARALRG